MAGGDSGEEVGIYCGVDTKHVGLTNQLISSTNGGRLPFRTHSSGREETNDVRYVILNFCGAFVSNDFGGCNLSEM